jgi:flagellar assembly factor FliW
MTSPSRKSEEQLSRIASENVLSFSRGLPGFPKETRFALLQHPSIKPLAWLQSIATPDLAFVVSSPFSFFPDYRPDVPEEELTTIGSPNLQETLLLTIVRVLDTSPVELHMNLKAPVIINLQKLLGNQVILKNEAMYSERAVYRFK